MVGNITLARERLMNTRADWCVALREITEVSASRGERRHIYLWLSQSHYTRILTARRSVHPSEMSRPFLSSLSSSLSPIRNPFLISDRSCVHQTSLEGRSTQPSLLHFITSPRPPPPPQSPARSDDSLQHFISRPGFVSTLIGGGSG